MEKLENTQAENIHAAALLISESIQKGGNFAGIRQRHSYAAIEVCDEQAGLIPPRLVRAYCIEGM